MSLQSTLEVERSSGLRTKPETETEKFGRRMRIVDERMQQGEGARAPLLGGKHQCLLCWTWIPKLPGLWEGCLSQQHLSWDNSAYYGANWI